MLEIYDFIVVKTGSLDEEKDKKHISEADRRDNSYCVVFNNIICSHPLDLKSGTAIWPR